MKMLKLTIVATLLLGALYSCTKEEINSTSKNKSTNQTELKSTVPGEDTDEDPPINYDPEHAIPYYGTFYQNVTENGVTFKKLFHYVDCRGLSGSHCKSIVYGINKPIGKYDFNILVLSDEKLRFLIPKEYNKPTASDIKTQLADADFDNTFINNNLDKLVSGYTFHRKAEIAGDLHDLLVKKEFMSSKGKAYITAGTYEYQNSDDLGDYFDVDIEIED